MFNRVLEKNQALISSVKARKTGSPKYKKQSIAADGKQRKANYMKLYRKRNTSRIAFFNQNYYSNNKTGVKIMLKQYHRENERSCRERNKRHHVLKREKILEQLRSCPETRVYFFFPGLQVENKKSNITRIRKISKRRQGSPKSAIGILFQ
eukprot:TRINITY_DN11269_c0_g1_i8.p1 TRINITY_DN11269_c0_g1~~TRINITY_DN11269_c0_g1_i8.p1  ORF type:complete len:151 (-),score=16.22 TRINITY_DN11269_c0_g1_i8:1090-1542(-)